jgi:hypothetical protein
MASRAIKGILARNSWDFYEYSSSWAYVQGPFGGIGYRAYLTNPGTAQGNLDVYRAEISLSNPIALDWSAYSLSGNAGTNLATESALNSCETGQPMPLGAVGIVSTGWPGNYIPIRSRLDQVSYDLLTLQFDGPFITLAPGWALVIEQSSIGNVTAAATFYFQTILDQVSQAR